MAKIIEVTAADSTTGEPQREALLGEKSIEWCRTYLDLDDDPLGLEEKIELVADRNDRGGTKHVFVKLSADEGSSPAGFYPSGKSSTEIRELLRHK